MRSSIGATKIFTLCFILLYLFSKVKMCACSQAASKSINDGDINYYNSDASSQSSAATTSVASDSTASPEAKNHRRRHAVVAPNIHHVRHENHYVKNPHFTRAQQALHAYKSSLRGVSSRMDNHLHTSHHRPRGHHSRMHHHFNKNMHKHQSRGKGRSNSVASPSFKPSTMFVETKFSHNNISQVYINHKNIMHHKSNSIPTTSTDKSSSPRKLSGNKLNNSRRSGSSTYSKNYFEELLNTYKMSSPYYKDNRLKDPSLLVKSLPDNDNKCNGKKCETENTEEESEEYYYDYEYEYEEDDEEDEDAVGNAEAQGDAGYSTTARPRFKEIQMANSSKLSSNIYENHTQQIPSTIAERLDNTDTTQESATQRSQMKKVATTDASRLASYHAAKVKLEGSCFTPKPKMILASNDPSKQYTPHCTILHRCGDDVGCCLPTQTCAASKNSTVELYFFVKTVGLKPSIERLSFINHTECACFSRNESPQGRVSASSTSSPQTATPICACPSLFQRVIDDENRCICDCSSSDTQCDQFKRGLEHFSMENRRCIKNGRCNEPLCEYGHYNKAKGKCPTREDKLSRGF